MFERLRRTLVESYVGAIGLGYLLADCILRFVNIFSSPVATWLARNEFREFRAPAAAPASFELQPALPEAISFFLILVVWYFLLRWLYFKPLQKTSTDLAPSPEQSV